MRMAVIGGTGLVGEKVVATLRHRGHEVVVASRQFDVNTLTNVKLATSLRGAKVVIDVINSPSCDGDDASDFFRISTTNVVAAAEAARSSHYIVLSVVGTERMTSSGYFRGKLIQETLVTTSRIPHTILRSTQFFDFLHRISETNTDHQSVRIAPAWSQPIGAGEVAAALADLSMAAPRNGLIEHAGPQLFRLDDLVRRLLTANGDERTVIADTKATYFGAPIEDDTLLPDEGAIIGVGSFDEWLRSRTPTATAAIRKQLDRTHSTFDT